MTAVDPPYDATPFLPERRTPDALRDAAARCRGCPLYAPATQTVFGEGPVPSHGMLVGEVPGDREDRDGHPFVGPAGRELDGALERLGIDRTQVYVTNAVKHFKFEERGKRRIHQKPTRKEVKACLPWFEEELRLVSPEVLVILGATAGKALLGPSFKLTEVRGRPLESDLAPVVLATIHPSAILRSRDDESRMVAREGFTKDLETVADLLRG